ncbi:MAG: hypothetical protein ACPHX7_10105, partial [Candidatus Puniceispirillaceae bacterium]
MKQVQEQLKAVGENSRQLSITLYLTGAKKEDLQSTPNPKPGSVQVSIWAATTATATASFATTSTATS